jgi:hypothetical protein
MRCRQMLTKQHGHITNIRPGLQSVLCGIRHDRKSSGSRVASTSGAEPDARTRRARNLARKTSVVRYPASNRLRFAPRKTQRLPEPAQASVVPIARADRARLPPRRNQVWLIASRRRRHTSSLQRYCSDRRGGPPYTILPPTSVVSTFTLRIASGFMVKMSSLRITRSASLPGVIEPFSFSWNSAKADPRV